MLAETMLRERITPAVLDMDVREARAAWNRVRVAEGLKPHDPLLTAPDGNSKLAKNHTRPTWSLSLLPAYASRVINVCARSTPTCRAGCVAYAGHGQQDYVTKVRLVRTLFLAREPEAFFRLVTHELWLAQRREKIACRLNGFSDLGWHLLAPWLVEDFPRIEHYAYSKRWDLVSIPRYRIVYSASERTTLEQIVDKVESGCNVAVVVGAKRSVPLPKRWGPCRALDGDRSDERWREPLGRVVLLRAKGRLYGQLGAMNSFVKPLEVP